MSWFWLLRPWSYAATLVPFLLGAGSARPQKLGDGWNFAPACSVGAKL